MWPHWRCLACCDVRPASSVCSRAARRGGRDRANWRTIARHRCLRRSATGRERTVRSYTGLHDLLLAHPGLEGLAVGNGDAELSFQRVGKFGGGGDLLLLGAAIDVMGRQAIPPQAVAPVGRGAGLYDGGEE